MWRFFKDFMTYGVVSILGKLAVVFLMPIYTSILTKEEYGAMALITSCKGIIDLISNLNIHSGIARDYYEESINRKRLVSTGFFSIFILSSIICTIGICTQNFWSINVLGLEEKYSFAFLLMLLSIPCGSLLSYFAILTRFKKKPILYSVGSIMQLITQIGLSVYCVVFLRTGISGVFLSIVVSEVIGILYFSFINRSLLGWSYSFNYIKRALLFAIPTLPAIVAGWLDSSVGQIVIGKTISKEQLGVYSIALSLSSVFTLLGTALQNVWSPFLYENYKKETFNRDIHRLYTVFVVGLTFVSITLSLFSKEVILLLTNKGYLDARFYITLLCVPMCFYLLFPMASSGVSISRDTKYVGYSYVAGSIMNIAVLYATIEYLGIIAVPLCLALSRIITYMILYKVSEKKISYKLPNYLLLILCVAVSLCYFMLTLDLSFITRICIYLVLGGASVAYLLSHKNTLLSINKK